MPDDDCPSGVWEFRPRPKPRPAPAPEQTSEAAPSRLAAYMNSTSTANPLNESLLEEAGQQSDKPAPEGEETTDEDEIVSKKGVFFSFLMILVNIPALIGAWCFPALVAGIIGTTVTAAARTTGHKWSLTIKSLMMLLVFGFLFHAATLGNRRWAPTRFVRWGPCVVMVIAAGLILFNDIRQGIVDGYLMPSSVWNWCGNNPQFDRINSTDPFPSQCLGSATQFWCTVPCCAPTWIPTDNSSHPDYFWAPPAGDNWGTETNADVVPWARSDGWGKSPNGNPSGLPGPFATVRPDGTSYVPPGYTVGPLLTFVSTLATPLVFYETGDVNPTRRDNPQKNCKYGVNNATGYCFLTNVSLPYAEQLKQLPNANGYYDNSTAGKTCNCDLCTPQDQEDLGHLAPWGVWATIVFNYTGFVLMAVAVGWNASILKKLKKIKQQWKELRGQV